MIGYHYSNNKIELGSIITSNQHKTQTFPLFWEIYNRTKPELPNTFGYAYPIKKEMGSCKFLYIVESSFFIFGNLNHSIYKNMDAISSKEFITNKSIPLKERLAMRTEWIKQQSIIYFNNTTNQKENEMISNSWEVIEIIKLPFFKDF